MWFLFLCLSLRICLVLEFVSPGVVVSCAVDTHHAFSALHSSLHLPPCLPNLRACPEA